MENEKSPTSIIVKDSKQLDRIITRITYQILDNHNGAERIAIVGMKTRGEILAQRIVKKIKEIEHIDVPLGVVDPTLYRDDFVHTPELPLSRFTQLPFNIDAVTIILVDDVLGTGRTIRAAIDCIIDFGRPINIEVAVLCDRKVNEFPIVAKYVGRKTYVEHGKRLVVNLQERDGEDKVFVMKNA
jgi:pyrimidine operon attenuation protein/uracil phosphoribosyltransferase